MEKTDATKISNETWKKFAEALARQGIALERYTLIPYTRHTQFIPDGSPACLFCESKELIHGEGRYIIFDFMDELPEKDKKLAEVFFCGRCLNMLEEEVKLNMDFM